MKMFFLRRTLQIVKTKFRLIQKFQVKFSNKLAVKRNCLYLNGLNTDKFKDKYSIDFRKEITKIEMKKEMFVIEFNSELDWENSVLKSTIPVVVNCYAEYISIYKTIIFIYLNIVGMHLVNNFCQYF